MRLDAPTKMTKPKKLSYEAVEAFKADLLAVCEKHGMTLEPYYIDHDAYDSEEGLNVVPITGDWDLYYVHNASAQ